jgi:hypothetical protein
MLPPHRRHTELEGETSGGSDAGDCEAWAAAGGGVIDGSALQGFTNPFGSLIGVRAQPTVQGR